MPRHESWARFRGITAENAQQIQTEGRRVLGDLMNQLKLGGIRVGKMERLLPDGTRIIAQFDGTTPMVTAIAPTSPQPRESTPPTVDLWIPQGFVVYPASDMAPQGWGTPVVQETGSGITPYSPVNLAPGLDAARWTPGGRLGEVLLTRVSNAGYPTPKTALPAPLMFDAAIGLHPPSTFSVPAASDTWGAYRVEFVAFAGGPDASGGEQAQQTASKRALFEAINTHRAGFGRTPFLLPQRGRSDTAQETCEVMHAAGVVGHFSARYPRGFQCSPDRTTRDGLVGEVQLDNATSRNKPIDTAEMQAANYSTRVDLGVDPSGFHVYEVHGGADITATQAMASYLAEPAHKAGIEAKYWDGGHASLQIGFKRRFNAVEMRPNTGWIAAGNRYWNAQRPEVPTLSWFGFAALNLGFETWPIAMNTAVVPPADPIIKRAEFVYPEGCWLDYQYAFDPAFDYSAISGPDFSFEQLPFTARALDNRVFARGRCIGIAPKGGLVWAAAIQTFESPDADQFDIYRLVILSHHAEDQPPDWRTHGMTRYLRVWWCDLPRDGLLAANPHVIVRGVYGEESEGWPWDQVNNPASWRGGDLVDAGAPESGTPMALKYASQWVFSPDGMRAVCLRDRGAYASYVGLWTSPAMGTTLPNQVGLIARAFELSFGGNAYNPLTVAPSWRARNAGATAYAVPTFGTARAIPIAAGYDASGAPSFAMQWQAGAYSLAHLYFGDYDSTPTAPLGVPFSVQAASDAVPSTFLAPYALVLDVRDRVAVAWSVQPENQQTPTGLTHNPAFNACWYQTASDVLCVSAYRADTLVHQQWYPNPDRVIPYLPLTCPVGGWGTLLQGSLADLVVPSYASDGTHWVLSYVVQPQPQQVYTPAVAPTYGCGDPGNCRPVVSAITTNALDEFRPASRGGWMTSSFADTAPLAALMHTPGARPRALYARVV